MGDLTKDFNRREFACKDGCGLDDIDLILVMKLQMIHDHYGKPIKVHSGCRCPAHNLKEGGKFDSAHLKKSGSCKAVDVECLISGDRYTLLSISIPHFRRIGIGKTFLHFDVDSTLPQNVVWLYS